MEWKEYLDECRREVEQFGRIAKAQNRGKMSDSKKYLYILKLQNVYRMENQPWDAIYVPKKIKVR